MDTCGWWDFDMVIIRKGRFVAIGVLYRQSISLCHHIRVRRCHQGASRAQSDTCPHSATSTFPDIDVYNVPSDNFKTKGSGKQWTTSLVSSMH